MKQTHAVRALIYVWSCGYCGSRNYSECDVRCGDKLECLGCHKLVTIDSIEYENGALCSVTV